MIREEALHEDAATSPRQLTPPAQASSFRTEAAGEERGPGLLSKMLRQPGALGVRTVSLHNLLDQTPAASQLQPPTVVSNPLKLQTLSRHCPFIQLIS